VDAVAQKLKQYKVSNLVVDPVMVSTSGTTLMNHEAIGMFRRMLLPLALLVTPNIDEAAVLTGLTIRTPSEMEKAAGRIAEMGARYVLIKGGHLEGDAATDILYDGQAYRHFTCPRLTTRNAHGTGCVLSSSIVAYLALGKPLAEA